MVNALLWWAMNTLIFLSRSIAKSEEIAHLPPVYNTGQSPPAASLIIKPYILPLVLKTPVQHPTSPPKKRKPPKRKKPSGNQPQVPASHAHDHNALRPTQTSKPISFTTKPELAHRPTQTSDPLSFSIKPNLLTPSSITLKSNLDLITPSSIPLKSNFLTQDDSFRLHSNAVTQSSIPLHQIQTTGSSFTPKPNAIGVHSFSSFVLNDHNQDNSQDHRDKETEPQTASGFSTVLLNNAFMRVSNERSVESVQRMLLDKASKAKTHDASLGEEKEKLRLTNLEGPNAPDPYAFSYAVSDAEEGMEYHHEESSNGHRTRGSFRVSTSAGLFQTRTYFF